MRKRKALATQKIQDGAVKVIDFDMEWLNVFSKKMCWGRCHDFMEFTVLTQNDIFKYF